MLWYRTVLHKDFINALHMTGKMTDKTIDMQTQKDSRRTEE